MKRSIITLIIVISFVMQTFLVMAHEDYGGGHHMMSWGFSPFFMGVGWIIAFVLLVVLLIQNTKK